MLRADHQFGVAGENHGQRISAFQAAEGGLGGIDRRHAALQIKVHKLRHRFGVGFGGKLLSCGLQFGPERRMVFNNAVMPCGWALLSVGAPWVAQRVWPIPVTPGRAWWSSTSARLCNLPLARRRSICPFTSVAMPALS